jgi:hypothetical protein
MFKEGEQMARVILASKLTIEERTSREHLKSFNFPRAFIRSIHSDELPLESDSSSLRETLP